MVGMKGVGCTVLVCFLWKRKAAKSIMYVWFRAVVAVGMMGGRPKKAGACYERTKEKHTG